MDSILPLGPNCIHQIGTKCWQLNLYDWRWLRDIQAPKGAIGKCMCFHEWLYPAEGVEAFVPKQLYYPNEDTMTARCQECLDKLNHIPQRTDGWQKHV